MFQSGAHLLSVCLQQLDHCRFWDSLWYHLFARLAKHDVHGMLDALPNCV